MKQHHIAYFVYLLLIFILIFTGANWAIYTMSWHEDSEYRQAHLKSKSQTSSKFLQSELQYNISSVVELFNHGKSQISVNDVNNEKFAVVDSTLFSALATHAPLFKGALLYKQKKLSSLLSFIDTNQMSQHPEFPIGSRWITIINPISSGESTNVNHAIVTFFDQDLHQLKTSKRFNTFSSEMKRYFSSLYRDQTWAGAKSLLLTDPNKELDIVLSLNMEPLRSRLKLIADQTQSTVVLFDRDFGVLMISNGSPQESRKIVTGMAIEEIMTPIIHRTSSQTLYEETEHNGLSWSLTLTPIELNSVGNKIHAQWLLAQATSHDILTSPTTLIRKQQWIYSLAFGLMALLLFAALTIKQITSLKRINKRLHQLAACDFQRTKVSMTCIKEIAQLSNDVDQIQYTLQDLYSLLGTTSNLLNIHTMAATITSRCLTLTKAESIVLYDFSPDKATIRQLSNHSIIPFKIDPMNILDSTPWVKASLLNGDVVHLRREDSSMKQFRVHMFNSDIYLFPVTSQKGDLIGLMIIGYERAIQLRQKHKHNVIKALLNSVNAESI